MEQTYTIVGADGAKYGPISLAQIKGWVAEGRVNALTQVMRSDQPDWRPAAQFAELGLGPPRLSATAAAGTDRYFVLERRAKSGADWLIWVAGLAVANAVLPVNFFFGDLGIPFFLLYLLGIQGAFIPVTLAVSAVLALCGWFARGSQGWGFIAGMILYGLDTVAFVVTLLRFGGGSLDWLSVAIHAYVLYRIVRGWQAHAVLKGKVTTAV